MLISLLLIFGLAAVYLPVQAKANSNVVSVPGDVEWVSTGIYIDASTAPVQVNFSAIGHVITGPANIYGPSKRTGPDGQPYTCYDNLESQPQYFCALSGAPWGMLVGKVGADGDAFAIGSSNSITVTTSGFLYLTANDYLGTYYDNTGSYTVTVKK